MQRITPIICEMPLHIERDSAAADVRRLSNKDLLTATSIYRERLALGELGVTQMASLHEAEMSRRFGGNTTVQAPFSETSTAASAWWKFW